MGIFNKLFGTTQNKTITENIQRLDNHLSTLRPDFYAGLRQPLNDTEINNLEQKYNLKIPTDLRLLYQWKNGQQEDSFDAFVNNSMFMPLEEALETAKENTSMIGSDYEIENWWNEQWIPIFHNGGGDYICYDLGGTFTGQAGQLIEFWHADNDRNVIAPTLETFISKLNDYYTNVKTEDFDDYFEVEDVNGYPKKFFVE